MESRTILLTLHIAAVAAWLGADFFQYAMAPRMKRDSREAETSWVRQMDWFHARYYAAVAVVVLLTGIGLVFEGDWSWSAGFIWVGIAAIVGGGTLGGGGLGTLNKKRLAALEAGDKEAADEVDRKAFPLSLLVTALPLVALLAMVDKWQA
jgi:hypothetical protein